MTSARIGVVLAGGLATRMGGDKAGAMLGGRTLLEHAVAIVRAAGLEPRVCARADTALPTLDELAPGAIWREPPGGTQPGDAHPLAGLAHAARVAGEPIVAMPVDLPLLPPAALAGLAASPRQLAVLGTGGRPVALVARLGPEHADPLTEAAASSAPALRTLLALHCAVIDLAALVPAADPGHALLNVNSPADLRIVAALYGQS